VTAPPSLAMRAAAELEIRNRRRSGPLMDFVPWVSPRWDAPRHLEPLVELFERIARGERVRALVSLPPQHGKTETTLHGLIWILLRKPETLAAFATYNQHYAYGRSRQAIELGKRAGLEFRDADQAMAEWRTKAGGGLLATGVGGTLTGYGVQLLVVDDPFKNRQEAESATVRDGVDAWFRSTALSRLHPGASALVVHTRWHPDDLIGRLEREGTYDVINLAAIRPDGSALWPSRRPLEFIEDQRRDLGDYEFESLYLGRPKPRGASVFSGLTIGEPAAAVRYAIGVDLAYSARTKSDYSTAVVLALDAHARPPTACVVEVLRIQCDAPAFGARLAELSSRYPGAGLHWYAGGTEKGVADLLASQGVKIQTRPALADKFVRAQATAAAWNGGRITVRRAPWLDVFARELSSFTGAGDLHDDQVDALVAAWDALATRSAARYDPQFDDLLPSIDW
jgi:phage terminase large subunit-like protein